MIYRLWVCAAIFAGGLAAGAKEDGDFKPTRFDWPQWQGVNRDSKSLETGLLDTWPKEGPELVWKAKNLGGGYSTPSVAAGRIFGMAYRGGEEIVWALEEGTGKELWAKKTADTVRVDYGEGPRSSPTVDGDFVYVLGLAGDIVCLKAKDGEIVWSKNVAKDFGGVMMSKWGWSESPLVDGDLVLCTPGVKNTIVALNKKNGEVVWKANVPKEDKAGYSSIIKADLCGQKQYVQFLGRGVVGISDKGKYLWRYDRPANTTANCSTPIAFDDHVFAASSYGTGGGLAKITFEKQEFNAEQVYFNKDVQNHHGGLVLLDGFIYGSGGSRRGSKLLCIDAKTGKEQWGDTNPGKGSISYADGHLYYRDEKGPVFLVEATSKKYVEKGRFSPPDRSRKNAWCHPVIANGKLYLRDQDVLHCYDIKKGK